MISGQGFRTRAIDPSDLKASHPGGATKCAETVRLQHTRLLHGYTLGQQPNYLPPATTFGSPNCYDAGLVPSSNTIFTCTTCRSLVQ